MKSIVVTVAARALLPTAAWGHGGGVDKYGCHNDKKAGDYHCHEGTLQGRSYKSES